MDKPLPVHPGDISATPDNGNNQNGTRRIHPKQPTCWPHNQQRIRPQQCRDYCPYDNQFAHGEPIFPKRQNHWHACNTDKCISPATCREHQLAPSPTTSNDEPDGNYDNEQTRWDSSGYAEHLSTPPTQIFKSPALPPYHQGYYQFSNPTQQCGGYGRGYGDKHSLGDSAQHGHGWGGP
jgi:hypothetical protein